MAAAGEDVFVVPSLVQCSWLRLARARALTFAGGCELREGVWEEGGAHCSLVWYTALSLRVWNIVDSALDVYIFTMSPHDSSGASICDAALKRLARGVAMCYTLRERYVRRDSSSSRWSPNKT